MRPRILIVVSMAGLLATAAVPKGQAADPEKAAVVKAHAAALAAIRSFDIVYETYYQWPNKSGDWNAENKGIQYRWSKDGSVVRSQSEWSLQNKEQFNDEFYDGTCLKTLSDWNPHKPPALTPRSQQGVRCWIYPPSPPDARLVARPEFLLSFAMSQVDKPRSLQDLVSESPKVEFRIEPQANRNMRQAIFTSFLPGIGDNPPSGDFFVIALDPTVNYMARRVEEHRMKFPMEVPGHGFFKQHGILEREVTNFKEFEIGVFFPTEVRQRIIHEPTGTVVSRSRFVVTKLVVNQPLPKDALDFRFPNNALATKILDAKKSKAEAWLWGPNNKPIKRIRSGRDLPAE